jgi:translation initiation factor IF-3
MNYKQDKNTNRLVTNNAIRSSKVLCIDHNNTNLGLISTSEAIKIAYENGLDLVQIAAGDQNKAPTCKILDSGKLKYELSKKKKESDKKQRESIIKLKEIKFRPTTDLNDLKTKAKKAQEFLEEGHRVKVTIQFRGREITHQEVAVETLTDFMSFIPGCQMDGNPSFDAKCLVVFITK